MEGIAEQTQSEESESHLFIRDFPEDVKRQARGVAIMAGQTFRAFVTAALIEHTRRVKADLEPKTE